VGQSAAFVELALFRAPYALIQRVCAARVPKDEGPLPVTLTIHRPSWPGKAVKDGVASLAYVPAIRAETLRQCCKVCAQWRDVDARDKRGHDAERLRIRPKLIPTSSHAPMLLPPRQLAGASSGSAALAGTVKRRTTTLAPASGAPTAGRASSHAWRAQDGNIMREKAGPNT
jgi:hypothetical protein